MALESRGVGPWARVADSVPVTEKGVLFGGWRDSDLEDGTVTSAGAGDVVHAGQQEGGYASAESKPFMTEEGVETGSDHAG